MESLEDFIAKAKRAIARPDDPYAKAAGTAGTDVRSNQQSEHHDSELGLRQQRRGIQGDSVASGGGGRGGGGGGGGGGGRAASGGDDAYDGRDDDEANNGGGDDDDDEDGDDDGGFFSQLLLIADSSDEDDGEDREGGALASKASEASIAAGGENVVDKAALLAAEARLLPPRPNLSSFGMIGNQPTLPPRNVQGQQRDGHSNASEKTSKGGSSRSGTGGSNRSSDSSGGRSTPTRQHAREWGGVSAPLAPSIPSGPRVATGSSSTSSGDYDCSDSGSSSSDDSDVDNVAARQLSSAAQPKHAAVNASEDTTDDEEGRNGRYGARLGTEETSWGPERGARALTDHRQQQQQHEEDADDGEWECSCLFVNDASAATCSLCGHGRPGSDGGGDVPGEDDEALYLSPTAATGAVAPGGGRGRALGGAAAAAEDDDDDDEDEEYYSDEFDDDE